MSIINRKWPDDDKWIDIVGQNGDYAMISDNKEFYKDFTPDEAAVVTVIDKITPLLTDELYRNSELDPDQAKRVAEKVRKSAAIRMVLWQLITDEKG